jgi:hypothetical protein
MLLMKLSPPADRIGPRVKKTPGGQMSHPNNRHELLDNSPFILTQSRRAVDKHVKMYQESE